ncbi:hypothetical protein Bca4012_038911 [Brassica carinata]
MYVMAEGETLSRKADVHSFGVILLELITGEKAYSNEKRNEECIATWFEKRNEDFWNSIDVDIDTDHQTQQSVEEVAELAGSCCATEAEMRPEMSQIVRLLSTMIETRERRNQASSSGS